MPTLLVVDGNSLLHRAWHGYARAELATQQAACTEVLRGFCALLAGVSQRVGPAGLAVGFDDPDHNVRRVRHPAYKGTRPPKPQGLQRCLAAAPELLRELGARVVVSPGQEADDVLGSAAAAAVLHGWSVVLATSDRDAVQLVSPRVQLLRLANGLDNARLLTAMDIEKDYGVPPQRYVELAALRGDVSDNLPGAAGVGPKTAAALLSRAELSQVLDDPALARELAGARGAAIIAAREQILLNLELMRIRTDLPECSDLPDSARLTTRPAHIAGIAERWGIASVAPRLVAALADPARAKVMWKEREGRSLQPRPGAASRRAATAVGEPQRHERVRAGAGPAGGSGGAVTALVHLPRGPFDPPAPR